MKRVHERLKLTWLSLAVTSHYMKSPPYMKMKNNSVTQNNRCNFLIDRTDFSLKLFNGFCSCWHDKCFYYLVPFSRIQINCWPLEINHPKFLCNFKMTYFINGEQYLNEIFRTCLLNVYRFTRNLKDDCLTGVSSAILNKIWPPAYHCKRFVSSFCSH